MLPDPPFPLPVLRPLLRSPSFAAASFATPSIAIMLKIQTPEVILGALAFLGNGSHRGQIAPLRSDTMSSKFLCQFGECLLNRSELCL
jgi:hypothetical protein